MDSVIHNSHMSRNEIEESPSALVEVYMPAFGLLVEELACYLLVAGNI